MPRSKPQAEDEGEADAPKKMTRRGLTSSEKTDLTEVFALVSAASWAWARARGPLQLDGLVR